GEVRGLVADQEPGQLCDVLRLAPPPQRRLVEDPLLPGGAGRLAPRGADPPRRDAVDADLRGEAESQRPRKAHDRVLGGGEQLAAVAGHAGRGLVPADVEDRALSAISHLRTYGPAQFDGPANVDPK